MLTGKLPVNQQVSAVQVIKVKLKGNQASSSKPRVLSALSSVTCSSGGTAASSSQDPNEPRQEVSHLAMVISNDDDFTDDPHQIIPTEAVFGISLLPRENNEGFNQGYLLLSKVTVFQGIYYHESGDVRPG